MPRDRRIRAAAQIAIDAIIVLVAAYILTIQAALIVAIVLGLLFVRWWRTENGG